MKIQKLSFKFYLVAWSCKKGADDARASSPTRRLLKPVYEKDLEACTHLHINRIVVTSTKREIAVYGVGVVHLEVVVLAQGVIGGKPPVGD